MKKTLMLLFICTAIGFAESPHSFALDVETGAVLSGYNDVKIPNNRSNDEFSLSDGLETDPKAFSRFRFTYTYKTRHSLSLLVAPLKLEPSGKFKEDITFQDKVFARNTQTDAIFKFNSYRLTYRFNIPEFWGMRTAIGVTGKIRDAKISLENATQSAEKTDVGFVPLISFRIDKRISDNFSFVIDGEALGSSQGRAEDIMAAIEFSPVHVVNARLGYRMLEGGADVDEVYNFAMLHYLLAGLTVNF